MGDLSFARFRFVIDEKVTRGRKTNWVKKGFVVIGHVGSLGNRRVLDYGFWISVRLVVFVGQKGVSGWEKDGLHVCRWGFGAQKRVRNEAG